MIDPTVTTEQVRAALNEIDESALPDATIEDALDDAEILVESQLPADLEGSDRINLPDHWDELTETEQDEWIDKRVDHLIKHIAKRKAFNSSGAEVNVSAMEASVSMDINAFRGQLRRDVEQAWEALGFVQGGDSSPFVDATGHAPSGGTSERSRRASHEYHR